jgi:hypothetical protein
MKLGRHNYEFFGFVLLFFSALGTPREMKVKQTCLFVWKRALALRSAYMRAWLLSFVVGASSSQDRSRRWRRRRLRWTHAPASAQALKQHSITTPPDLQATKRRDEKGA